MQFQGILIAVSDMERAKCFYEMVMEQKVVMDLGVHVSFESGFSLQSNYGELVGTKLEGKRHPDNFQLYFEVENLDEWQDKLSKVEGIELIHKAKEYPWGQRALRFYDLDQFIVEVAESMESVARRFLDQGLSVEETAECTMYPVAFVKQLLAPR